MFPCDQPGAEGFRFTVYVNDVSELLRDHNYVTAYREAVTLGAMAWGWDLSRAAVVRDEIRVDEQYVYLLAHSLYLFRQTDMLQSLQAFLAQRETSGRLLRHPQLKELMVLNLSTS
jgi:hypothetical protein